MDQMQPPINPANPAYDAINERIFQLRRESYDRKSGPRTGDWVRTKDGEVSRITVTSWGDCVQIGGSEFGCYYFDQGYMSYSGGCGRSIPVASLQLEEGESKLGMCWFFNHDFHAAHNDVSRYYEHRVYTEV